MSRFKYTIIVKKHLTGEINRHLDSINKYCYDALMALEMGTMERFIKQSLPFLLVW